MMKKRLSGCLASCFLAVMVAAAGSGSAIAAPAVKGGSRILVAYFSQPEEVRLNGVDGFSGASVLQKNNVMLGSTQYLAQIIQQETGADIFRIETVKPYPRQHQPLLDSAQQELKEGARPALKSTLPDLADYDTLFIGYPIWWYKMPMAMYSFFEQQDLSGKTVIPFTTHGGSRFSDSIREISRLQPQAKIISRGLAISRDDVADKQTPKEVVAWLNKLSLLK